MASTNIYLKKIRKYIKMQNFFIKRSLILAQGFSIIEIIIYLAIFTVMSIVVINSFIIILSSFSGIHINYEFLNSGSMAMERISREIRQSKNIDMTHSVFDSNSSIIRLNDTDGSSYIDFYRNGNNLEISKNGTEVGSLLTQDIIITKLEFNHIITTNSEAVKIEIDLQNTKSKINRTEKFYDTVVLRGGY